MTEINKELKGLGGWLILICLGLIFTPLRLMFSLFNDFAPIFLDNYWEILTTPGAEAYHYLWGPLIISELITNFALIVFSLYLLFLYFTKSYRFPKLMIIFYIINLFILVGDYIFANMIPEIANDANLETVQEIIRAVAATLIWVPYFLKSQRVKNTFVKEEVVSLYNPRLAEK